MESKELLDPIQPIQLLVRQAQEELHQDSIRGAELAKAALEQLRALSPYQNAALEAKIYQMLGIHLGETANISESYASLTHALSLFEELEDVDNQIRCLHVLQLMHFRYGEASESLNLILKILELLKSSQNKHLEVQVLVSLGSVYNKIGDYEQERITYERAEAINQELNRPYVQVSIKNNQAMVSMALEEYEDGLRYVAEALDILQREGANYLSIIVFCTAGEICTKLSRFEEAEQYFRQSEILCNKYAYEVGKSHVYQGLSELYMAKQAYGCANQYARQSMQQAQTLGMLSVEIASHLLLSKSYKQLGNLEQSLLHFETYHELHQKTYSDQMKHQLANLRVIYETEKAQKSAQIFELKNVILEQEIQKRKAVEQSLRETNEDLQAFAHMVAHDLRSPLGSVAITIELILLRLNDLSTQQIRQRLMRTYGIVKQSAQVVDDLLILAMPDKDEIELEQLEMTSILAQVLAQNELMIKKYAGEILLPNSWHTGLGYKPWVARIWSNLLSNGIKYGGRPYRVVLGSELVSDTVIRYWIDDNGSGIPVEKRKDIFTPFTRLDPDRAPGTGLGLAIVSKSVHQLNGRLGIETNEMGGSRFYFELPTSLS